MLCGNQQKTLLEINNLEHEYLKHISKEYYFQDAVQVLDKINWDFKDFTTQYLAHTFHPYPARFIPQIPLSFIKLFTKEKETVLAPMCGCGATVMRKEWQNLSGRKRNIKGGCIK